MPIMPYTSGSAADLQFKQPPAEVREGAQDRRLFESLSPRADSTPRPMTRAPLRLHASPNPVTIDRKPLAAGSSNGGASSDAVGEELTVAAPFGEDVVFDIRHRDILNQVTDDGADFQLVDDDETRLRLKAPLDEAGNISAWASFTSLRSNSEDAPARTTTQALVGIDAKATSEGDDPTAVESTLSIGSVTIDDGESAVTGLQVTGLVTVSQTFGDLKGSIEAGARARIFSDPDTPDTAGAFAVARFGIEKDDFALNVFAGAELRGPDGINPSPSLGASPTGSATGDELELSPIVGATVEFKF